MKKLVYLSLLSVAIYSCNKETSDLTVTPTLDVEMKNMGVYAVRTATWCGPCGNSMDNTHQVFDNMKDVAVAMAFKDAFSEAQSAYGNFLFDKVTEMFDLGNSVPTYFQNFNADFPASINEHLDTTVILSGNYEIEFNGNDMVINTTTKFFMDYVGEVFVAPFIIVDGIVGYQNGHADSPNTVHKKYVADVAIPATRLPENKYEWGYLVSFGLVKNGHTVNLKFTAQKDSSWANHNISVGLIYFRKVGNELKFLNAFTK